MLEDTKISVSPEKMGTVLFDLVLSRTEEFVTDKQMLNELGLGKTVVSQLNVEMIIVNMFLIIKQVTKWEADEEIYDKVLDQMHFLLFHQLKTSHFYSEKEIEDFHNYMFYRYSEYGDGIEKTGPKWMPELGKAVLANMNSQVEYDNMGILMFSETLSAHYQTTALLLDRYEIESCIND